MIQSDYDMPQDMTLSQLREWFNENIAPVLPLVKAVRGDGVKITVEDLPGAWFVKELPDDPKRNEDEGSSSSSSSSSGDTASAATIRVTARTATNGLFDYALQKWDSAELKYVDQLDAEEEPVTGTAYELTGVRTIKLGSLQQFVTGPTIKIGDNTYPVFNAPEKWLYGKLSGGSEIGANIYSYAFTEHEPDALGEEGPTWTATAGGLTGTCYNEAEPFNTASGLQGNGVDLSASSTSTVMAIGQRIVKIYERFDCNGVPFFLFSANNLEDCS